jgi:hypothetical protein
MLLREKNPENPEIPQILIQTKSPPPRPILPTPDNFHNLTSIFVIFLPHSPHWSYLCT